MSKAVNDRHGDDKTIIDDVLAEFGKIASVPRPSHHEEKISSHLQKWADAHGFKAVRDNAKNVIIDVPATAGMEHKKTVALQAHMDMVFACADPATDPLTTAINVINDGEYISTGGKTSLGADNGIGLAIALCLAKGKVPHGPLRLIVTADEEDGATGAKNLHPDTVKDVSYMINIDVEDEGTVIVSSASSTLCSFTADAEVRKPAGNAAFKITLDGLTGGHSGVDIDKKRLNAIIAMGNVLQKLKDKGIAFELASWSGGSAVNAIPAQSSATVVTDDPDALFNAIKVCETDLRQDQEKLEPHLSLRAAIVPLPETTLVPSFSDKVIFLAINLKNGVYTMSEDIASLVESSSSLGLLRLDASGFSAVSYVRSSSVSAEEDLLSDHKKRAALAKINCRCERSCAPWPYKKDNRLLAVAKTAYKELFDKDVGVKVIHAGLECGIFAGHNPDTDIIAVGPTIISPHSVNEKCRLDTIPKVWRLLARTLAEV